MDSHKAGLVLLLHHWATVRNKNFNKIRKHECCHFRLVVFCRTAVVPSRPAERDEISLALLPFE